MSRLIWCITLLSFISISQAADGSMRPGLWEVTTTSKLLSLVSQIPPDQMKNIGDFAKEYGFDMPAIQNGAAKSNVCITKEMSEQKVLPDSFQTQAGCIVKNVTHNGNSYQANFVCDNAQFNGNGVAEGVFTTQESFTGTTTFNGTVQGNPISDKADIAGKWLNSSCESN